MLILTEKEIKKIIPLDKISEVNKAVERAFFCYGKKEIQMPAKLYLYFKKGDLRIMPSFSPELGIAGTKIVNVHPENPKINLKTVMAVIILNDSDTGLPLVLMDGTYITAMRTGAASAVATKYLSRKDALSLGVVGAGIQAITQIAAISQVRKLKEIVVFDIRGENVEKLAKTLKKIKIKIKKTENIKEAAEKDILVTSTPSRKPIIKADWIREGAHINAIGADAVGKQELDPKILKKAKIVVDDWAQASHSGEINVPLKKGIIKEKDIYASLGEIVVGKKKGRINDKEITIFDSTGLAIQDLYTAELVYRATEKKKDYRKIKLF